MERKGEGDEMSVESKWLVCLSAANLVAWLICGFVVAHLRPGDAPRDPGVGLVVFVIFPVVAVASAIVFFVALFGP